MRYKKLFDLNGKVAVVTGGSGLIGKELVKGFSDMGAITVSVDIDKKKSKCSFEDVDKNIDFKYMDMTKEKPISDLIKDLNRKYKHIDIWINNAYPRTHDWGKRFENVSLSSWKKNVDMHLGGYFIASQKIAEYMKKKRSGSIINIASIYGTVGPDFSIYKDTRMTMPAAYSAIKGGVIAFTKYLASLYGEYNVRVNCISPGGVNDKQPKAFKRRYVLKTPLRRMAETEDVVGAVLYLASDASKYITGHNLPVDGGWTIT